MQVKSVTTPTAMPTAVKTTSLLATEDTARAWSRSASFAGTAGGVAGGGGVGEADGGGCDGDDGCGGVGGGGVGDGGVGAGDGGGATISALVVIVGAVALTTLTPS